MKEIPNIAPRRSIHSPRSSEDRREKRKNTSISTTPNDEGSFSEDSESEISNSYKSPPDLRSGKKQEKERKKEESPISSFWTTPLLWGITIVFIASFVFKYYRNNPSTKNCSYRELAGTFPKVDNKTWADLSTGIENILNEETDHSGVYLFVHEDNDYLRKFVKALAKKSSSCYENGMKPMELGMEAFQDTKDYGRIVKSFKDNLQKSRVILIANLNEIPAESAKALHEICDTYSPIAKNAIIYLTLVSSVVSESPTKNVRTILTSLWGPKMKPNELDPLITRVTDMVIQLKG